MTAKPRRCRIVGYLRTSTDDQLLSIDAQRDTVDRIAEDRGCTVARCYTEHESGGDNTRPQLAEALEYARCIKASLCVAKLDRLARDSQFLMSLVDGDVPVIFGDLPEVEGASGRVMVQMIGNFAEFERNRMSERMKAWHAARAKAGLPHSCPENCTDETRAIGRALGSKANREKAVKDTQYATRRAQELRDNGKSLRDIAAKLNELEIPTRNGSTWTAMQVSRILNRVKPEA